MKIPQQLLFIATNKRIISKIFFAPNSPIFCKSCGGEEDGKNRQMQSALLFKKTQKTN